MELTQVRNMIPERLQAEAQKNECFAAICTVFALRERTRSQVTVQSLMATMEKEGFKFSREQYEKCLVFLATLHIGKLDHDMKGRVRGLKNINITLQSIGLASVGKQVLKRYSPKKPFTRLPEPTVLKQPLPEPVSKAPVSITRKRATLEIKHGQKT